jgi:hypothetical protein
MKRIYHDRVIGRVCIAALASAALSACSSTDPSRTGSTDRRGPGRIQTISPAARTADGGITSPGGIFKINVPPVPPPTLQYYGGRVIGNVQIVQVIWNSGGSFEDFVQNGELAAFYAGITNSRFIDMLSEYNTTTATPADNGAKVRQVIGRGSFGGAFTIAPSVTDTMLTDDQIRAELAAQIAAGQLPSPQTDGHGNPNTIYFLNFPQGVTINLGPAAQSCKVPDDAGIGFCAYHETYVPPGGPEIYYAVMPDFRNGDCAQHCRGELSPFERETTVASHELAEAITDAEIGLVPSAAQRGDAGVPIPFDDAGIAQIRPAAWIDVDFLDRNLGEGDEVGDICARLPSGQVTDPSGASWTVQRIWSSYAEQCVLSHISNGGFEGLLAPTLAGWTTTPNVKAVTVAAHGVGGMILGFVQSGGPAGASQATQTFDLPYPSSGGSVSLSFANLLACDSPGTGFFSASLTDVGTGTSITLVPPTCATTQGFAVTSSDVTGFMGRTVTLTLQGNDPTGLTRAYIDDVNATTGPAPSVNAIQNPGFEGFDYKVTPPVPGLWIKSGAIAQAPSFTGYRAALTGSATAPTPGDSSLSQEFVAPAGVSALQLWVRPECTGAVANDWAIVALVDNTTGTTATLLPQTCNNSPLWTRVTGSVVPGHDYTLVLASHDDGAPDTPMSAAWDDVSLR